MRKAIGVMAIVIASVLFALALLAVVPAPTYNLWKLKILVTECGHMVAPVAFLTLIFWRQTRQARIAAVIATAAGVLMLTPAIRAIGVLRTLPTPRPSVARFVWELYSRGEPHVAQKRLAVTTRDGATLEMLFFPAGAPAHGLQRRPPLVVMIHGGSWQGGLPAQLAPLSYRLVRRGYAVASVTYRFAPAHKSPQQLHDVQDAIATLRARADALGFDPDRVILMGRSAGGQLALLEAYTSHRIAAAISFYGPTDLVWGYEHPSRPRVHASRRYLNEYIGGDPQSNPAGYRDASPITFADSTAPPTLLIHGGSDELVFIGHSQRLEAALLRARRPATLITLPWATHGCDYIVRGPCYEISAFAVTRFLERVAPL